MKIIKVNPSTKKGQRYIQKIAKNTWNSINPGQTRPKYENEFLITKDTLLDKVKKGLNNLFPSKKSYLGWDTYN